MVAAVRLETGSVNALANGTAESTDYIAVLPVDCLDDLSKVNVSTGVPAFRAGQLTAFYIKVPEEGIDSWALKQAIVILSSFSISSNMT